MKITKSLTSILLSFVTMTASFSSLAQDTESLNNAQVKPSSGWIGLKTLISNLELNSKENKDIFDFKIAQSGFLKSIEMDKFDLRTSTERNKINEKMIALAEHISDEHDIEINKAQKIINTTFLEAQRANIEPILMLSVIGVESRYKQFARSKMGAVGLVQVIPTYHRNKINGLKKENLDIWSVEGNIKIGVAIMKEYIALANGDIQRALQMYNGSTRDTKLSYSKKVFNHMDNLDKALTLAKL